MNTVICTLIMALLSQGAVPGLVLCFDAAGHFEIESVLDGCCAGASGPREGLPGVSPETPNTVRATSPCGPCTDTPVFSAPIVRREADAGTTTPASTRCLLPRATLLSDLASYVTARYRPSTPINPTLVPVSTTILLI